MDRLFPAGRLGNLSRDKTFRPFENLEERNLTLHTHKHWPLLLSGDMQLCPLGRPKKMTPREFELPVRSAQTQNRFTVVFENNTAMFFVYCRRRRVRLRTPIG